MRNASGSGYAAVLRNREFVALLLSQALSTAGNQLARVAIALLVFGRTGSGLAASATYAISYLTFLAGGPLLSALADRYPRRVVMVVCDLLRFPVVILLCLGRTPLWLVFALVVLLALLGPPFDSARSAIQPDILLGDDYVTGSALMNIVMQAGEVLGFVAGGALVAAVSVRGALLLDAVTFLLSAVALILLVRPRPAAQCADTRSSLLVDTAQGLRHVRRSRELTRYLTFSALGSAALITPEGLAVPVARDLHGGPFAAGVLTACVSIGFVVASILVVRMPPAERTRLLFPLSLLAMIPLILTPLAHTVSAVAALWVLAGLGASLNLIASTAYMQASPVHLRSRTHGVAVTIVFAVQGASLLIAGALAGPVSSQGAVAVLAAVMLLLLLILPGSRTREAAVAQGDRDPVRGNTG